MFLCNLVPWPPIDIRGKFYGDRPRETHPVQELNAIRGVAKYSDFGPIEGYISERCKIGDKLVLITYRKSYNGLSIGIKIGDLE